METSEMLCGGAKRNMVQLNMGLDHYQQHAQDDQAMGK